MSEQPEVTERGEEAILILSAPGPVTAAEALALAILTGEIPIYDGRLTPFTLS